MTIKVQVSLFPKRPARMCIYNFSRSFFQERPISRAVAKRMGGRVKAYFHAHLDQAQRLHLGAEAGGQNW